DATYTTNTGSRQHTATLGLFAMVQAPSLTPRTTRKSVTCGGGFAGVHLRSIEGSRRLEVGGLEARVLGDSREDIRADLVVVVPGKHVVWPTRSLERSVGARLALHGPTDSEERTQDAWRLRRRPDAHAAWRSKVTELALASNSPCSRRSAMTRNASALTAASAAASVSP